MDDAFQRFFDLSIDMMCIANTEGYFTRVNPAFGALGYSLEELTARPFLDFVHPDDVAATLAEVEKLGRGVPTIHFENRYRNKDGTYRWLSWMSQPDGAGTLYAIARDVTERRLADEARARLTAEVEAANRELETFSYSVAHDLRAPLRSIDGFSQALLEDWGDKLDEDGRRYLGFVRQSAQLMAQLIDDILTLAKVNRGELRSGPLDLSAIARGAYERIARGDAARKVELVIAPALRAQGDPRLLGVVFDNLLGNAWKFTSKRPDARIEVGATTRDGEPVYFVRDNGAGFDMTYASKLFGVFQRLHAAQDFEGTGIGLATVQRIVARHGGRVWAEGKVGAGATFYFTLGHKEQAPWA